MHITHSSDEDRFRSSSLSRDEEEEEGAGGCGGGGAIFFVLVFDGLTTEEEFEGTTVLEFTSFVGPGLEFSPFVTATRRAVGTFAWPSCLFIDGGLGGTGGAGGFRPGVGRILAVGARDVVCDWGAFKAGVSPKC